MKIISAILAILLSIGCINISGATDEGNPIFVTITTGTCYSCKKLKPVIEELEYEYYGKVNFITLDVSNKSLFEESRQIAEEKGISKFFEENKGAVPRVGILCPDGVKTDKVFTGETRKEIYTEALDAFLTDTSKVCSL